MIKYGLIGISSILPRFLTGLKKSKDSAACAVSSRNNDKAEEFAVTYDIPHHYGDYRELLGDPDVDVVYISTPNNTHYEIALAALAAGKNVILEKPFTVTYREALELIETAEKLDLFIMEGQKAVFLPTTKKIKELISEGAIGRVDYIYLPASSNYKFPEDNWMNSYDQGGGSLLGSACYGMAFASYICGSEITKAQSLEIHQPDKADYLTNLSFQLAQGTIVNTVLGMEINTVNRCYIYGSKGHIYLDNFWKSKALTLVLPDKAPQEFLFPYDSEFTFYIDHVSELLQAGFKESPVMTRQLTLQIVKFVDDLFQEYLRNA